MIINREQFEHIKRVFEEYEVDRVVLSEESLSGIGPNTYLEFDPATKVKIDITDVESW